MIKALVDTNVLLDMMVEDRPDSEAAASLFNRALNGDVELAVCAGSLKDVYYIARRELSDDVRRAGIGLFLDVFDVFPVDSVICRIALASDEPDYEDGIVRACAEWWSSDFIVSRDVKAFDASSVPRIDSPGLISILGME